jgi:hypothetical protein
MSIIVNRGVMFIKYVFKIMSLSLQTGGGNDELNADGGKSIRLVKFS